jgi:signal transduction histidine kinase/ligand-binding sensor domain-containing protein
MHGEPSRFRCRPRRSNYILLVVVFVFVASPTTFFTASPPAVTFAGPLSGAYLSPGRIPASQSQGTLPHRLAFTHIAAQQGLSSDLGQATVQDREGFIWVATSNGLNRYDGSGVVIYQHKQNEPGSLSNTFTRSLFVDNTGKLWVGTNSGLNAYDNDSDSFKAYVHDPADPASLSADAVLSIFQDRSGTLWIGTDGGGLDKFDPTTQAFTAYRHDPTKPASLSNDSIRDIYQDRAGNLWVATYGGGLNRFDVSRGEFTAYRHNPADPRSISSDLVTSLAEDKTGKLWVGTWRGGLNRFDPVTGNFTAYLPDPAKPGSLNDDRVMSLCVDSSGALWVGTYSGGVSIYDARNDRFQGYPADPSDVDTLSHNRVLDLFEDRLGLMWVTTEGGGINLYNPQQQAFTVYRNNPTKPDSLASNGVYAIYQDPKGIIWIGTQDRGLDRLDPTTGKATHYPPDPSDPQKLGFPTIYGITGDGEDGLWITTYGGGLYHLDTASGIFTGYHHDPANPRSLGDDTLSAIARDREGNLWLSSTTGLHRFDPATGLFTAYRSDPTNPKSLTGGLTVAVMVAQDGMVWTSGPSGLNRLDPSSGEVTRYRHDAGKPDSLADNFIFKVYQDSSGTIWAAGYDGTLNRFNPQTGGFDHFLQDTAGPAENIASVLEERINGTPTGHLWIMRDHSLVNFDTRTEQHRVFTTANGLPGVQATRGGSLGNNGELLLGSTRGLIIIDPAKVQIDTEPPQVALTDFLVENTRVTTGENSVLKQSIDRTDRIELAYGGRIVSFGFTALSFRGPQQVRYRYRLEGFDSDWNEVGSTRRLATYTNLPAGNYVFRVTASNADGVWNPTGRTVSLVIKPPWWDMLWSRVAIMVLAVSLAGMLYWLRVRSFEKRQRALERGISERTAALASANVTLEAEIGVRKQAEGALKQSNEELWALNQIAQTLTGWVDLKKTLHDVGTTISSLFGGAGLSIWALDEQQRVLTRLLAVGGDEITTENHKVLLEDDRVSGKPIHSLQIAVVDSPADVPLTAKQPNLPVDEGAGGAMLVPLQSHGSPVGLMCIRAVAPEQTFTQADTVLAQTIAGTLANALENARLLADERAAAAEEERSHLAAELHDSVSQSLYAANLTADVLIDLWNADPDKGRRASLAVQQFTRSAIAQMRTLLVELRPEALINTSLHDLLDTLKVSTPPGQDLTVDAVLATAPLMPAEVQIACYRIAQEALNNVVKHARAHHARIILELSPAFDEHGSQERWCGTLTLRIADDGRGFDMSQATTGRLGMGNMRERAEGIGATLSITSRPGEGTQVEVIWTGCAKVREQAS